MWHWLRRAAEPGCLLAAVACAAPLMAQTSAEDLARMLERLAAERAAANPPRFGENLLLGLRINGLAQPQTVRAVRLPEGLAIPQTLWQELKLRPPTLPPRMIDGEPYMILGEGPGELVRWQIEDMSQTLVLDAPPQAFGGQQLELAKAAAQLTLPPQLGFYGNYDLQWQRRLRGRETVDGLFELGALTPHGDLNHLQLYRNDGRWLRLETRWTLDQPEHLTRWRLGDSVAQPGAWGRAMRFGGLQWGTDFSLRPGFLSFPLPTLRGEASLPSTVDVFVNNSQRLQGRVQQGPFDISDLPLVTGQGEIRTVVRDLLGREQVVVQPYYISPSLLKPGLSAYSLELGWLREDYGLESNRYGRGLAQLTWRRGQTDEFTHEWRAELARGQQTAGASGLWLVPSLGTANASIAVSRSRDPEARSGWMAVLGLERQGMDWSGGLQLRRASAGFVQQGQPVSPRWSIAGSLGTQIGAWGVGLGLVQQGKPQRPNPGGQVQVASQLWSLNAGRSLGGWGYLGLSALRVGGGGGTSVSVFWSLLLDEGHSLASSWQGLRGGGQAGQDQWQLQLQRNPPAGEGLGYQALVDSGGRRQLQGQWQGDKVTLTGGASKLAGQTDLRAGASGGMAWMDGSAYVGRRIDGGFAVVQVGDQPEVRVTHDNQPVARTDAKGRAFLPTLRGYQVNRIGVVADDLPLDAEMDALELQVMPAARTAALIRFPVQRSRSATFMLVDEKGQPLPPGSELRVPGSPRMFPLGLDGRAFVAGLSATVGERNRIEVRWEQGLCFVDLVLPQGSTELPELGKLTCRPPPKD